MNTSEATQVNDQYTEFDRSKLPRRFQGYSDEELMQYAGLRAIEWRSWIAFIAVGVAPLIFPFANVWVVIVSGAVLNFLWSIASRHFVPLALADIGVYLNKAAFITAPLAFGFLLVQHEWVLAVFVLAWGFILGNFMTLFGAPSPTGDTQMRILRKLYGLD